MLIYIMLIRSAVFPFVPSPSDRVNQGDWDADRIRGKIERPPSDQRRSFFLHYASL